MIKCTAIINKGKMYDLDGGIHKLSGVCNGEMIEYGTLVRDVEPDGPLSLNLRKATLYQCESCKTIRLI